MTSDHWVEGLAPADLWKQAEQAPRPAAPTR
jgi:hypothetical protein